MYELNKSYVTYAHITFEMNLTGRTQPSTHKIRF